MYSREQVEEIIADLSYIIDAESAPPTLEDLADLAKVGLTPETEEKVFRIFLGLHPDNEYKLSEINRLRLHVDSENDIYWQLVLAVDSSVYERNKVSNKPISASDVEWYGGEEASIYPGDLCYKFRNREKDTNAVHPLYPIIEEWHQRRTMEEMEVQTPDKKTSRVYESIFQKPLFSFESDIAEIDPSIIADVDRQLGVPARLVWN